MMRPRRRCWAVGKHTGTLPIGIDYYKELADGPSEITRHRTKAEEGKRQNPPRTLAPLTSTPRRHWPFQPFSTKQWRRGFLVAEENRLRGERGPEWRVAQPIALWRAVLCDAIRPRFLVCGCFVVGVTHPTDGFTRQRLLNSLAEIVDPVFLETDQSRRGSFNHLLQQANVWGAIVRQRIDLFQRARPGATSAPSVRFPARDLQHILDTLLDELGRLPAVASSSRIIRKP